MKQDRISDALLSPSAAPGTRLGQALLWQPSYVRDEKILWHVPFLFWLLEATRPRQYVEIGVGEGVAYMAVCQALHRMRAHAQCYAVGSWKESDGSVRVPDRLAARNADLYEDFSQILSDGPQEAAKAIEDKSVDLMLVDLTQAPEVAASLHERWIPKLSENGILLLYGVDRGDDSTAVLVSSLSDKSPTIRIPGGDGLLVTLPSREPEEELANIAALSPDDPAHKLVIQMFTRLGAGTYYETHVRDGEQRTQALDEQIRALREERDSLMARLEELQAQYDSRHHKVAILQSRDFDLQVAMAAVEAESERLTSQLGSLLEQEKAARADAEEKLGTAAAEAERLKLQADELAKRHDEESRHHQRLAEELTAARGKEEELFAGLRAEQSERADAEQARDEALERLEQAERARAEGEEKRDDALRRLDEETTARAEAEEKREEALRRLDEETSARAEAESATASVSAEAEMLRGKVTELTLHSDRDYRAVKSLIEAAEQSDNLVTALTEELRSLRQQVEAQAAAAEIREAEDSAAQASGGLFGRLVRRRSG